MQSIFTSEMIRLSRLFAKADRSLWLVGGAVRDSLLGIVPKDFDFATDATPSEQIAIYEREGLRYVPTGLQHGTVSVYINGEGFEITTLRIDADHDGRHASVEFTRDITLDLARRDLTINAMALTFDGELIDPFGGQDDLANKIVRFVGSPQERIEEDYLRILRWVRFHQRLANDQPYDTETLNAVTDKVAGLKRISVERVWAEMSKALAYDNADRMMAMIQSSGIGAQIGLAAGNIARLRDVAERTGSPLLRLVAYFDASTSELANIALSWKMSANDRDFMVMVASLVQQPLAERDAQEMAVVMGQCTIEQMDAACVVMGIDCYVTDWVVPTFPITGNDLIAAGLKPGPELGRKLKSLRLAWFEAGYEMSKDSMMADL